MTAEDLEVLESRKFVAVEVARLFGVPPPLVEIWDDTNFASSAEAAMAARFRGNAQFV